MGRIFSWSDIKQRKIPRLRSFVKLSDNLRHELGGIRGVTGAILFGSVLRGEHHHASDLDCLVLYEPDERGYVMSKLAELAIAARQLDVPLAFIPLDTWLAQTPMHHVGLLFATHLRWAIEHGGLIKKNPLDLITFDHLTPLSDMRAYLRYKFRFADEGLIAMPSWDTDDPKGCEFLGKMLHTPVHVARNMLALKGIPAGDSRSEVLEAYATIAPRALALELQSFSKVQDEYLHELHGQLVGIGNERTYRWMIERIALFVYRVPLFLKNNALMIDGV